ncbi:MAG: hypothetical protein C0606_10300 [Hyphomicrobiales bacterium]|nr:MAG: hypothetical protein C0606_10300 [Hyphomicrobiales bacterium]
MPFDDAVTIAADHMLVRVRLTPKANRDDIDGVQEGADGMSSVTARVRAVPEKGAANAALQKMLAKTLRVGKTDVTVVSGTTARLKVVRIDGDGPALAVALKARVEDT